MKLAAAVLALALSCFPVSAQNQDATLVNGVDGYLSVPASPSLVPPAAITIEAWVMFNGSGLSPTNLYPTIVRKNVANGQEEYFLRVEGTGALRWKIKTSANVSLIVDSPAPMPSGVWVHVAGTYDGATARLFMNGLQVAQNTPGTIGTPFNGGAALRIGKGDDQTSPSEVWSGKIDEVRLWSVARTAAQIQATMNVEISLVPNLVSAWHMTGNGSDSVGSNHGTVVGTVTFGPSTLALPAVPPKWQVNQGPVTLDVDGTSSDGYTRPLVVRTFTPCALATATLNIAMNPSSPWNLGYTFATGVPAGGGATITGSGQILNLNVASPTFNLLFGLGFGPATAATAIPISLGTPITAAMQAAVLDPFNPDGYTLSSMAELRVVPGPTALAGPTGDDAIMAVPLASLCGGPAAIPFFGTNYSQFNVSSNGRVMFGGTTPSTSGAPSAAAALTGDPFVGAWCDLAPNLGGRILISSPAAGLVRVDYSTVRYRFAPTTAAFGIQFDAVSGAIRIDGLGGITPSTVNQFLGISAGAVGAATNLGSSAFVVGGPFAPFPASAMLYAFGPAGSLAPGVSTLVFLPLPGGGYSWTGF